MNPANQNSDQQQQMQPRPDQTSGQPGDDAEKVERIAEERIEEEVEHNRQGGH